MLIILEGPDGAGKTTLTDILASKIAARFPGDQIIRKKAGPPRRHPLDEYVVPLLKYRPGTHTHIICDRWHLGELVYPYILDRDTKMDAAVEAYVESFLQSRGSFTAIISPPTEEILKRFHARGTNSIPMTDEQIRIAHWRFIDLSHGRRNTELVDFGHGEKYDGDMTNWLIDCAVATEATQRRFTTLIGSVQPKTLLFGDVRACDGNSCQHKTKHYREGTAFMPYPATSGHYLFRALTLDPRIELGSLAFANACDVDRSSEIWYGLGQPDVVALGQRAANMLKLSHIPYAAVPHPQYVRRFHHAKARRYGNLIYEVIGTDRKELKWPTSSDTPRVSGPTLTSSSKS